MKKATVTVSFEQEKLKAVQFYAGKNGTSLELELDMFMEKLYKKYVPRNTGMVGKPVPAREMSAASTTVTP